MSRLGRFFHKSTELFEQSTAHVIGECTTKLSYASGQVNSCLHAEQSPAWCRFDYQRNLRGGPRPANVSALGERADGPGLGIDLDHFSAASERETNWPDDDSDAPASAAIVQALSQSGPGETIGEQIDIRDHLPYGVHRR